MADQAVGSMIEHLKKLGVYEQTLVIVIADHGESLFDDRFLGHGHALNQSQTRIPLIVNLPGVEVHSAVGQIDVADLLMRLATNRFKNADWNRKENPVLQLVGSLDNPQLIGTVSYGKYARFSTSGHAESILAIWTSGMNLIWRGKNPSQSRNKDIN